MMMVALAILEELQFLDGVLLTEVADGDSNPRQRKEEVDSAPTTEPCRLPRGQPAQLVEFGREEETCLFRELLLGQPKAEEEIFSILNHQMV